MRERNLHFPSGAHIGARRRWEQLPDKTCMTRAARKRGAVQQRGSARH